MKKIITFISIFILASFANAQIQKSTFIRYSDLFTGFTAQTWSAGDERVTEFVLPLTLVVPVNKDLSISATTSSAYATMTSANENLFGLTDTRILGSYITANNKMLVTAGVTIPTGKTSLESDQSLIASALAYYPLDFRVPSFGQGITGNLAVVYADKVADKFILGGGAGFVYKNGFEPFSNSDATYKPGFEASLNAGLETEFGRGKGKTIFTFDATYTLYGADKFYDKEVLKSGNKLILDARAMTKVSSIDLLFYLRNRSKGKNERGFGALVTEEKNSNGNQLEFGGIGYYPVNPKLGIRGLADIKLYSKNDYESNGATIFGIGAGPSFMLSRSFSVDLMLKFSTGSLNNKNTSTSVTGFEFGGGIKYRL